MIPSNIEREHILTAIREIESRGIPSGRNSRRFSLVYEGKQYPPKYVLSLANKFANGIELDPSGFSGGQETNTFLRRLGFDIEEILSPRTRGGLPASKKTTSRRAQKSHSERCLECKATIRRLSEMIYGKVHQNYKFNMGVQPEDFATSPHYDSLKEIYQALQTHRGHEDFCREKTLSNCDFFIPKPGFILEFDEPQHFTLPRKIALEHYPENLALGFDKERWVKLCETISAKDNAPVYRDEQRAWYDTLRDFLPAIKGLGPTVRLYSRELHWCSLNPEDPADEAKFRELIEARRRRSNSWVTTVILQSNGKYSNEERLDALSHIVDVVSKETEGNGVIVFPGWWFSADAKAPRSLYKWAEENIKEILSRNERTIIVCLGIDGSFDVDGYAHDQIAIAISEKSIEAIGRKFHPAPGEKGLVALANGHQSKEENRSRVFALNIVRYYLCVCYDSYGLRHQALPNPGIDVVLNLVHCFYPRGQGPAGDSYFAKHGFAGASKQWQCPVFGAVVYFNRAIPERWPSGVYWNQGSKSTREWRYTDNPIKPKTTFELSIKEGLASVRIYDFDGIIMPQAAI